jgi:hypothetical protein
LDIWEGLQDRARQEHSIGGKSVADVAERTSKSVGGDDDGGALFDETASWYARLRDRSEKLIVDTLNSNVRQALRPYHHMYVSQTGNASVESQYLLFLPRSNPWATLSGSATSATAANLSPTAEIDPLLSHLGTTLGFLSRALASAPLRRITRAVLATISSTLWDNVLTRCRFSTAGAAQLHADLAAICRVVDKQVGPGVAEVGLRRCLEGARLVGLPVKGGKDQAASDQATLGDEDWEAWGAGDEDAAPPLQKEENDDMASGDADLGLWDVEKRLFADNQAARDVLDELGLELLTENEARALLGRRVELAG